MRLCALLWCRGCATTNTLSAHLFLFIDLFRRTTLRQRTALHHTTLGHTTHSTTHRHHHGQYILERHLITLKLVNLRLSSASTYCRAQLRSISTRSTRSRPQSSRPRSPKPSISFELPLSRQSTACLRRAERTRDRGTKRPTRSLLPTPAPTMPESLMTTRTLSLLAYTTLPRYSAHTSLSGYSPPTMLCHAWLTFAPRSTKST